MPSRLTLRSASVTTTSLGLVAVWISICVVVVRRAAAQVGRRQAKLVEAIGQVGRIELRQCAVVHRRVAGRQHGERRVVRRGDLQRPRVEVAVGDRAQNGGGARQHGVGHRAVEGDRPAACVSFGSRTLR